jgi:GNAT superfamily N-acetyltransferase
MLSLRRAEPRDSELIHRFVVELAEYEREPDAVEVTPEVLRAQLDADEPPFECILADWCGEPVGFALYFHTYSTWRGRRGLWLEDLFVRPAHRGQGIGRALLARLAAIAAERGCARMEWSVLDWNAPAIGFYMGLGARPMDAWTTYRLSDEALHSLANDASTAPIAAEPKSC